MSKLIYTMQSRIGRSAMPLGVGVVAFAVMLVVSIVSVVTVRNTARAVIDQEVRENIARLASSVAATIDGQAQSSLIDASQESSDVYARLNNPLTQVINRTDGVRFVYTLRADGDELRFVLDGTPPGDIDSDGVEDHSNLMEIYQDPDPAAWASLNTGSITVTDEPYTDAWGTFMSGFAPIRAADARVDCVVGIDVSVAEYSSRLARVDRAAAWALVPSCVLSLIAGVCAWWVTLRFVRYAQIVQGHREEAEQANDAKSKMLAEISHELRTPLTAIAGFVDIAMDERGSSSQRWSAAGTIRRNAEYLLTLVNDLLDMSKAQAGAITIDPRPACLGELIESAVSPLRMRAQEKGIELQVRGLSELPGHGVLDQTRVRQILINLLSNAVKFTDRGQVCLHARVMNEHLILRVEDTGSGMSPEQLSMLFQPFTQVGSVETRKQGTGLGLAISRHLAELMGGRILVNSVVGKGSVFIAEIPMPTVDSVENLLSVPISACVRDASMQSARVLVADDSHDNQTLIRYILTRAGAQVVEAMDGQIALDLLKKSNEESDPFDLLITDWDMPKLDGPGLIRAARRDCHTIPIVVLSAHAMSESDVIENNECDAYLTKPIDASELVRVCCELIAEYHRADRAA